MAEAIDYSFLSDLEGGSKTTGYVPAGSVSKSGVTIGTGFDLGQRSEADLKSLGLAADLVTSLKPYLGKKAKDAQDALTATPLTITAEQAESIDKAVKQAHIEQIKLKYNNAAENKKKFTDLPAEAQTVLASISFQYGTSLDVRAPKFWTAAKAQDWQECIKVLTNFGDAYPTRRKKEAALLGKIK
jgi:GH24 family phage-related lysozyme (muramidase)